MQDINDARDPAIQVAYEPLGAEEYVMVERYPPDDAVVSFQKAPGENSIGISTEASGSRRLTDFASCINALSLSAPNHYIATEYSSAYSNCFSYTIDSLYMGGLGDGWMIESDRPRMMYKWRDETMMESFSIKVNAYINPKFANSGDAYAKVRIPTEAGHLFRFNPDTHSDVAGHRFR